MRSINNGLKSYQKKFQPNRRKKFFFCNFDFFFGHPAPQKYRICLKVLDYCFFYCKPKFHAKYSGYLLQQHQKWQKYAKQGVQKIKKELKLPQGVPITFVFFYFLVEPVKTHILSKIHQFFQTLFLGICKKLLNLKGSQGVQKIFFLIFFLDSERA